MSESGSQVTQTAAETIVSLFALYGLKVIGAIIMLVVGFIVAGWLARAVDKFCAASSKIDPGLRSVLSKVTRIVVLVFTLVSVLNQFGFETTSLIALIGAAGLAIGLALQGTLTNVASGVMLLSFRPFKVGDLIDLNGSFYIIDDVGLFISRGHIPDGPAVTLPNSKIWGNVITNLSVTYNDQRRINEVFGISYSDDMGKAIALIKDILDNDERVLKEPEYRVAIGKLNDSSVDILVHAWTMRADWFATKLDLNRKIKEVFDENDVTIPFPQQDVHLVQELSTTAS